MRSLQSQRELLLHAPGVSGLFGISLRKKDQRCAISRSLLHFCLHRDLSNQNYGRIVVVRVDILQLSIFWLRGKGSFFDDMSSKVPVGMCKGARGVKACHIQTMVEATDL